MQELQSLDLQSNSVLKDAPKKSTINRLPTISTSQNESSKITELEEELDALRIKNIRLEEELINVKKDGPSNSEPIYFGDLSLKSEDELKADIRKLQTGFKELKVRVR